MRRVITGTIVIAYVTAAHPPPVTPSRVSVIAPSAGTASTVVTSARRGSSDPDAYTRARVRTTPRATPLPDVAAVIRGSMARGVS